MRLPIVLLPALLVAGCYSVDEIRERPVVWSANYAAPYDELTNCVVAQTARDYAPVPQIYPREKRAIVTVSLKTSPTILSEYAIQEVAPNVSRVDYRKAPSVFNQDGSGGRIVADRCAKTQ